MHLGTDWLANPPVARMHAELAARGSRLFVVGGHVRDAILGQPSQDVDFATDALPDRVIEVAEGLGYDVLLHGREFGSVILIADDCQRLDITTFRKDIQTDGRHATVVYTTDMAFDAHRRDFTINALYLDDTGRVHDPTGDGLRDLAAKRVRFVGQPAWRIHEDSLRILRFFRFNARFGHPRTRFDKAAVQAIRNCDKERLAALSGYRVTNEMLRIMQLPDPVPALNAMQDASVLAIFFPEVDLPCLKRLVVMQQKWTSPSPELARLHLLGPPAPFQRIEVPRRVGSTLTAIDQALDHPHPIESAACHLDRSAVIAVAQLQAALSGTCPPADLEHRIRAGDAARFPLSAADIIPRIRTEAIGQTLNELRERWIASRFVLTKAELLAQLDDPQPGQA